METKERGNTNTRPRRANAVKCVERLEMNLGGNKYNTQLTRTGKKNKYCINDMHKLDVDVKLTKMTPNKGIKKHVEIAVSTMYKEYTQLEDMKVIGELEPDSLTI